VTRQLNKSVVYVLNPCGDASRQIRLLVLSSGGTPELLLIGQKDQHHGTLGQGRLSQSH
jgi:hypothetical protein